MIFHNQTDYFRSMGIKYEVTFNTAKIILILQNVWGIIKSLIFTKHLPCAQCYAR